MSESKKDEAIRKIKKLMALADPNRGGTSSEVEAALNMIEKLVNENNLIMSEIVLEGDEIEIVRSESVLDSSKIAVWERLLQQAVAALCDCKSVVRGYQQKRSMKVTGLSFIGHVKDVAVAVDLFKIFRTTLQKSSVNFKLAADRRSYCQGYAIALHRRISEMKKQSSSTETGIVFVGKKQSAISKFCEKEALKEAEHAPPMRPTTGAFMAGFSKGMKDDIGIDKRLKEKERLALS